MEAIQEFFQDDRGYPNIGGGVGSEDGRPVSEQEYWDNYYIHPSHSYEWNDGRLEERPMTDPSSCLMYFWFYELLSHFLKVNPIGLPLALEFAFRLALPEKTSIRKPDLALILNSNPVQPRRLDPSYKGVFDLCVESLSHTGKAGVLRDTVVKKKEYEAIGVGEYYILDSLGVETAFYRREKSGRYEHIKPVGGIIQSAILPGFRFRVSDLYSRPSLVEMANDEVYADFVLPFYTEEKRKAERMAKKLRSLGLSEQEIQSLAEDR